MIEIKIIDMDATTNFVWAYNSPTAAWSYKGQRIEKTYRFPIRSAILLRDGSGVAVVEPFKEAGRDNAVVFDGNGELRFRLKFPLPEPHGYSYDQMYYVKDKLCAFANLDGTDFRYEVEESTGELLASSESR